MRSDHSMNVLPRHASRHDVMLLQLAKLPSDLHPHRTPASRTQLMEPASAQLAAAVLALINTLIARQGSPGALVAAAQHFSFARWGLEGYVISESNRLTGVWLLAR